MWHSMRLKYRLETTHEPKHGAFIACLPCDSQTGGMTIELEGAQWHVCNLVSYKGDHLDGALCSGSIHQKPYVHIQQC
jgi:hypothetical protein